MIIIINMKTTTTRSTSQKKLIKKEVLRFRSFFSAEKLYQQVVKRDDKIGIATIYRSLKQLVKEGAVHSYSCGNKTIYSSNARSHCHFICERCGGTKHIDLNLLDVLKKKVKGDVCHFQINVVGVCEECQRYCELSPTSCVP